MLNPKNRKTKDGKNVEFHQATLLDEYGNEIPANTTTNKVKGVAKMAAGGAIAAAGVPMLILPGPGALAVVGGAALAAKGHRDFTGREATDVERVVDNIAGELSKTVKTQTAGAGKKVASKVTNAAGNTVHAAADAATAAASKRFDPEKVQAVRSTADAALSAAANTAVAAAPVAKQAAKAAAGSVKGMAKKAAKLRERKLRS